MTNEVSKTIANMYKCRASAVHEITTSELVKSNLEHLEEWNVKVSELSSAVTALLSEKEAIQDAIDQKNGVGIKTLEKSKESKQKAIDKANEKLTLAKGMQTHYEAIKDVQVYPTGLITHAKKWLARVLTGRRPHEIRAPSVDKGNKQEMNAIDTYANYIGKQLTTYAAFGGKKLENDYFTGIPDLVHSTVDDIKISATVDTHPLFNLDTSDERKKQVRVYVELLKDKGIESGNIVSIMMSSPADVIEREAFLYGKANMDATTGESVTDDEMLDYLLPHILDKKTLMDMLHLYPYADLSQFNEVPIECRIKIFPIEQDEQFIAFAQQRVISVRNCIADLIDHEIANNTPVGRYILKTFG